MNPSAFRMFTEPVGLMKRSPGVFLPAEGVFSRLFPDLPPHQPDGPGEAVDQLRLLAKTLYDRARDANGKDTGKGKDDGVVALNRELPAAYTFFSQFVAHDLSFDPSKFGQRSVDGVEHANLRTPRLDLDVVYGGDPDLNENYYKLKNGQNTYLFKLGGHEAQLGTKKFWQEDLPRFEGRAQIPDQRQDQHAIIAQLHLALMKLHNAMMARALPAAHVDGKVNGKAPTPSRHPAARDTRPRALFMTAQRLTRWYYQYAIVEDLIPRMLGSAGMVTFNRYRECWETWRQMMMEPPVTAAVPLEFSAGAFRVTHSTLRSRYQVNGLDGSVPLPLFPENFREPTRKGVPTSLFGGTDLHPTHTVSWEHLVEVPGREKLVQRARVFSTMLPRNLSRLPPGVNPSGIEPSGLAEIDLERGLRVGLPSGQSVARRLGIPATQIYGVNDPLWYYCMKEARNGGASVGPVAAAIISKVILDLLHMDPGSYLSQDPTWRPSEVSNKRQALSAILHLADMPFTDTAILARRPPPATVERLAAADVLPPRSRNGRRGQRPVARLRRPRH